MEANPARIKTPGLFLSSLSYPLVLPPSAVASSTTAELRGPVAQPRSRTGAPAGSTITAHGCPFRATGCCHGHFASMKGSLLSFPDSTSNHSPPQPCWSPLHCLLPISPSLPFPSPALQSTGWLQAAPLWIARCHQDKVVTPEATKSFGLWCDPALLLSPAQVSPFLLLFFHLMLKKNSPSPRS